MKKLLILFCLFLISCQNNNWKAGWTDKSFNELVDHYELQIDGDSNHPVFSKSKCVANIIATEISFADFLKEEESDMNNQFINRSSEECDVNMREVIEYENSKWRDVSIDFMPKSFWRRQSNSVGCAASQST